MQGADHIAATPTDDSPTARGDGAAHHGAGVEQLNPRPRKQRLLRWLPWVRTSGRNTGNTLYLTFDDGPNPEYTPRLLDLLAAHDARATFFLIGAHAERYPELVRRIVEEGHALGNHSWSHPRFERISREVRLDEIDRTDEFLARFDGLTRHGFRPPRGAAPPGLMLDCALRGIRMVYWSYDSLDYSQREPAELLATMASHPVHAGEIMLMHDDSPHSHAILAQMLPQWREQGYRFEALDAQERAGTSPATGALE